MGSAGTWLAPGKRTGFKRRDYVVVSQDIEVPSRGVGHDIDLTISQIDHRVASAQPRFPPSAFAPIPGRPSKVKRDPTLCKDPMAAHHFRHPHCRCRHSVSPAPIAWQALAHAASELLRGNSAATSCFARAWTPQQ